MLPLTNPFWYQGESLIWMMGTCIEFNTKTRRHTNLSDSPEIVFKKKKKRHCHTMPHIEFQIFIKKCEFMWLHVNLNLHNCKAIQVGITGSKSLLVQALLAIILSATPSSCWGYHGKILERWGLVLNILLTLNLCFESFVLFLKARHWLHVLY